MTSHPHRPSQYQDGLVWVAFCKVCGAEGMDLSVPCPGQYVEKKKPAAPSVDKRVDKTKELD